MKKLLYFCSVALLGCLAFTACGDDDPATPDVKPIDNTEDSDTTINRLTTNASIQRYNHCERYNC